MRISRWRGVAIGCCALAIVSGGGLALAASGGTPSYTGCLSSAGAISNVAKGSSPVGGTCPSGSTTIKLSSGDITAITAGTGLSGGATSGAATLAVAPGYRLPQSCGAGQVAQATGTGGWQCADAPKALTADLTAGLDPNPNTTTLALPGGFHLRFGCHIRAFAASDRAWSVEVESDTAAEGNWSIGIQDDSNTGSAPFDDAGGAVLPAGSYIVVANQGVFQDVVRGEGQIVLHSGSHVTAITLHAIVFGGSNECQMQGVATPGS